MEHETSYMTPSLSGYLGEMGKQGDFPNMILGLATYSQLENEGVRTY